LNSISELSLAELEQIQKWSGEYEIAWHASPQRTKMQDWVEAAPEHMRGRLFAELLTLDGELRASQMDSLSQLSPNEICPFDVTDALLEDDWSESRFFREIDPCLSKGDDELADPLESARHSLLKCPTLVGVSVEAAEAFKSALQSVQFAPGDFLLGQGQPSGGLFVVVDGQLSISKISDGTDRKFAQCGAGSIVGEMSLLTGKRCTATVKAHTNVSALRLAPDQFAAITKSFPEIEIALSQLISDRLGSREFDALCGRTIGGYRLDRCISRGGMGVVYECRNAAFPGQAFALKMLRHEFIHDPSAVEQFEREAEVLRGLSHPNIVSVLDAFIDYRTRFLVMPMCDGYDLSRLLRHHRRLDEDCVRALIGQMTVGLVHAHQHKIIHMDLKPANVLMSQDGTIAIADFGLCNIVGTDHSSDSVMGTPAYMPPEQLRGDRVDTTGDWYALACMTYELLSGEKLFDSDDWMSLLLQKESFHPEQFFAAEKLAENVVMSDELRGILQSALRYEPDARQWPCELVGSWAKPVSQWMPPCSTR
jgi:CRP-like cAMP-binding protein